MQRERIIHHGTSTAQSRQTEHSLVRLQTKPIIGFSPLHHLEEHPLSASPIDDVSFYQYEPASGTRDEPNTVPLEAQIIKTASAE